MSLWDCIFISFIIWLLSELVIFFKNMLFCQEQNDHVHDEVNDENDDDDEDDDEDSDEDDEGHKLKLFAFLSKKDGANFNKIDSSEWSPIHRAIEIENIEILKLLIYKSKGADLNVSSCDLHTPLTYAIYMNNAEIVKELIRGVFTC